LLECLRQGLTLLAVLAPWPMIHLSVLNFKKHFQADLD
jgi:hypothetical protein